MHWLVFFLFLAVMTCLSPEGVSTATSASFVAASADISSEQLSKRNTVLTTQLD